MHYTAIVFKSLKSVNDALVHHRLGKCSQPFAFVRSNLKNFVELISLEHVTKNAGINAAQNEFSVSFLSRVLKLYHFARQSARQAVNTFQIQQDPRSRRFGCDFLQFSGI